jgi:hypothetical protein
MVCNTGVIVMLAQGLVLGALDLSVAGVRRPVEVCHDISPVLSPLTSWQFRDLFRPIPSVDFEAQR